MNTQLDMDKIAAALGAERRGAVSAAGGYFGAVQLAADIAARFRDARAWWTFNGPALDRAAPGPARATHAGASRGDCGEGSTA